jgi:methionine sulfoxide reductase heme-binding subunit
MDRTNSQRSTKNISPLLWGIVWVLVAALALAGGLVAALIVRSPLGASLMTLLNNLFAIQSVQALWYVTRAAGLIAYLLLWLSSAWGLAVSSKIFDKLLHRSFTYDFHQFISLLAVGFLALHIVVLSGDKFLPFNVAQLLVPFISPYRALWVGIGVIAFYLTLLVTITYYLRGRIGMKTFRAIHVLSLVSYLGATVHSFYSGTDTSLPAALWMYTGTFLVMIFLITYWLITVVQKKNQAARQLKARVASRQAAD